METIQEAAKKNRPKVDFQKYGMHAIEISEYIGDNQFIKGVTFAQIWTPADNIKDLNPFHKVLTEDRFGEPSIMWINGDRMWIPINLPRPVHYREINLK